MMDSSGIFPQGLVHARQCSAVAGRFQRSTECSTSGRDPDHRPSGAHQPFVLQSLSRSFHKSSQATSTGGPSFPSSFGGNRGVRC